MAAQSRRSSSPPSKTEELDPVLHAIGFEIEEVSSESVYGQFTVTPSCCQASEELRGGILALVAVGVGRIGLHVASGYPRNLRAQLLIDHRRRPAVVGDVVLAHAIPLFDLHKDLKEWLVSLDKLPKASTSEKEPKLLSSATMTLFLDWPVLENAKDAGKTLKK